MADSAASWMGPNKTISNNNNSSGRVQNGCVCLLAQFHRGELRAAGMEESEASEGSDDAGVAYGIDAASKNEIRQNRAKQRDIH